MQVTETLGPAWNRMKELLFRPFNLGTWFSWGFIFALQSCVEGGGGSNFNVPNGNSGGSSSGTHHYNNNSSDDTNNAIAHAGRHVLDSMSNALSHLGAHSHAASGADDFDPDMLIGIGIAAVIIMIPLFFVMQWIGARGQMMSIRSVAIGRADVGEAWGAVKNAGSSMFKFHLVVTALMLVVFTPVLGGGALMMYPMVKEGIDHDDVLTQLIPMLIGFAVVLFVVAIPFMILNGLARNFVAPIMLKYEIGSRDAWKRFWAVGRNHIGGIALFFILRMVFAGLAGVVGVIGGFLTCCLGFLPVLHQTLMAPYYVFERMWTLEILASMSPDFDLRTPAAPQGPPGGFGGPPPGYYGGPGYTPGMNPYTPPGAGGAGGGGAPPPPGGFGGPGY
jgi:hypothetical protein